MTNRISDVLLNAVAERAVLTDASDAASIRALAAAAAELLAAALDTADTDSINALVSITSTLEDRDANEGALAYAIDTLSSLVAKLQNAHRSAVPDFVTPETLREFLASQRYALEELEPRLIEAEGGSEESLAAIRRLLHTMKGEAGAIAFTQYEAVCHAAEDLLELEQRPNDFFDQMLRYRDWFSTALAAYEAGGKIPELALATTTIAVNTTDHDAATRALASDFAHDAADELSEADVILVALENDPTDSDAIDRLFRIFHTQKGVAGFLNLDDIVRLTHAVESLLNAMREKRVPVDATAIELLFESTELLRRMLNDVHAGASTRPELSPLIERIEAVASDRPLEPVKDDIVREAISERAATATFVTKSASETVKIELAHVDSLVELIGELMIVESMVVNTPEIAALASLRARSYLGQLAKISRDLQRSGMQLRMVPVRGIFQKMARVVRDLARKSNKEVRLVISGETTELDRSMVEQLSDPIIHLIRNAVDHGIESADERVDAGKPRQATVSLHASHQGGSIAIEVSDDGRGIDRDAILRKARTLGFVSDGDKLSDQELLNLIFRPGFSTASRVSEISGRGVGLDVVRQNLDRVRGRVLVSSLPQQGTTFKLVLPLTLAMIDGMLIRCGEERYIIPTLSVLESIQPRGEMLKRMGGHLELIDVRGEILPLLRLDRIFDIPGAVTDPTQGLVVIVESLGRKVGLLVDDVLTQQQIVIKGTGDRLTDRRYYAGATILADGKVGLILNVDEICNEPAALTV